MVNLERVWLWSLLVTLVGNFILFMLAAIVGGYVPHLEGARVVLRSSNDIHSVNQFLGWTMLVLSILTGVGTLSAFLLTPVVMWRHGIFKVSELVRAGTRDNETLLVAIKVSGRLLLLAAVVMLARFHVHC